VRQSSRLSTNVSTSRVQHAALIVECKCLAATVPHSQHRRHLCPPRLAWPYPKKRVNLSRPFDRRSHRRSVPDSFMETVWRESVDATCNGTPSCRRRFQNPAALTPSSLRVGSRDKRPSRLAFERAPDRFTRRGTGPTGPRTRPHHVAPRRKGSHFGLSALQPALRGVERQRDWPSSRGQCGRPAPA